MPGTVARLLPYLYLALANLFWAGNWVTGRAVRDAFGPVALNFWRWLIAALVLALFVLPQVVRLWPQIRRRWQFLTALSLCGVVLFQSLVYLGLRSTSTINAVLINSTLPVSMIAISWLMLRDTVTSRQMAGLVVSMVGVLVIVKRGEFGRVFQMGSEMELASGDFWILLAMPVWALYSVLLRRRPPEIGGMALVLVLALMGLPVLAAGYALEKQWIPQRMPELPALAGCSTSACLPRWRRLCAGTRRWPRSEPTSPAFPSTCFRHSVRCWPSPFLANTSNCSTSGASSASWPEWHW